MTEPVHHAAVVSGREGMMTVIAMGLGYSITAARQAE
jgi:hypothetical protein